MLIQILERFEIRQARSAVGDMGGTRSGTRDQAAPPPRGGVLWKTLSLYLREALHSAVHEKIVNMSMLRTASKEWLSHKSSQLPLPLRRGRTLSSVSQLPVGRTANTSRAHLCFSWVPQMPRVRKDHSTPSSQRKGTRPQAFAYARSISTCT